MSGLTQRSERKSLSAPRRLRILGHRTELYLFLIPGVVFFILFRYWPLFGSVIAFKDYNLRLGMWGSPWMKPLFGHFISLFGNPSFFQVFRNTIIISALKLIWGFPAPLILALLLNEVRTASFKRSVQTIIYLPHFISWPIIAGLLVAFLSPDGGVVNILRGWFGLHPIFFLANPKYFRGVLVISSMWKDAGWGTIIYLAAIASLDPKIYEAAIMDGANRLQQIRSITIPGILPTVVILLILRLGSILEVGFEQVFILYNPSVYDVADVLETFIYRTGILHARFDYATAAGLFLSVVGFVMILTSNWISRRLNQQAIF